MAFIIDILLNLILLKALIEGQMVPVIVEKPCLSSSIRLTRNVIPSHYEITFEPRLETFTFFGHQTINVTITRATQKIVLHSALLNISRVYFNLNGFERRVNGLFVCIEFETVAIVFDEMLNPGEGVLGLNFEGTLDDNMRGFYRFKDKVTSEDGQQVEGHYGAVTQFEPADARRAFPCFDEPSFKATFGVTLIAPKCRTVLSNMPIIEEQDMSEQSTETLEPFLKKVKFERSPVMSSYLVAMFVGKYNYIQGHTEDGITVRVYTPRGREEDGRFALEVAVGALAFFQDYFGVKYPLPKIDLVSIPDFSAGAMENWGLITFRENDLLANDNTSFANRLTIAMIVVHEVAHQWFGNLVTMTWWTDVWLNEGFASFMEILGLNYLFPGKYFGDQFAMAYFSKALALDALSSSHPIEVSIDNPKDINQVFDAISYQKGASVIRMLHNWIGDANFRRGMRSYLTNYAYQNTETMGLWAELEASSGHRVQQVMKTWTQQKGFPLIHVRLLSSTATESRVVLTQEKFSANGVASLEEASVRWKIPVKYFLSSNISDIRSDHELMESKSMVINVEPLREKGYIKLNPRRVDFYRVNYEMEMISKMMPDIQRKHLRPEDRVQLQDDLFSLMISGQRSVIVYLEFLKAFREEDEYSVWSSIDASIGYISLLLSNTDIEYEFEFYCLELMANVYKTVGWDAKETDGIRDVQLRALVIRRMGLFEDEDVVDAAEARFEMHFKSKQTLDPNIKSSVYAIVARVGSSYYTDALLEMYQKSSSSQEQDLIGGVVGLTQIEGQIKKILTFLLSEQVRAQDLPFMVSGVTNSPIGRDLAWDWFKRNRQELQRRYLRSSLMNYIIGSIVSKYASNEKADEMETFFEENPFPGSEKSISVSLELVRLKAKWLSRETSPLREYFARSLTQQEVYQENQMSISRKQSSSVSL